MKKRLKLLLRNKKLRFSLKLILGITILSFLIYKVGFIEILTTFQKINLITIILVIGIKILSLLVGNFNLFILLKPIYNPIRYWRLLKYYVSAWYISFFFPSKIGTASIIYFLRKEKIETGKLSALFVLDKILTLSWIILLAAPGFFIFLDINQSMILISILMAGSLGVLFFLFHEKGRQFIKTFILRKYAHIFTGFSQILKRYIKKEKKTIILNYAATITRWMLDSISLFILFVAFGCHVKFSFIFITRAVIAIIALIPLTANGLGIREGLALFFFRETCPNSSVILSVYLTMLVLDYLTLFIFFAYPFKEKINKGIKDES